MTYFLSVLEKLWGIAAFIGVFGGAALLVATMLYLFDSDVKRKLDNSKPVVDKVLIGYAICVILYIILP